MTNHINATQKAVQKLFRTIKKIIELIENTIYIHVTTDAFMNNKQKKYTNNSLHEED